MNGDDAKTRFLTAISHDMRQPLHALLLYLGALDRRVHDEEARAVLAKADRAAQSLTDMFESLISLARLEADKIEPEVIEVSLQQLFDDLADKVAGVRVDETRLSVRSDPVLLEIILRNLIANAITHGGGKAYLSAHEDGDMVEIAVRDGGPGIATEDQDRIFAEFTRLDSAPVDGLGLGLTIAKGLADLLGHAIAVRSALGAGATFVVRAPRG
jgi:signal transduction histidine kinase